MSKEQSRLLYDKLSSALSDVNKKINGIFSNHLLSPPQSPDDFEEKVSKISKLCKADGARLESLSDEWHTIFGRMKKIDVGSMLESAQEDSYNKAYSIASIVWDYANTLGDISDKYFNKLALAAEDYAKKHKLSRKDLHDALWSISFAQTHPDLRDGRNWAQWVKKQANANIDLRNSLLDVLTTVKFLDETSRPSWVPESVHDVSAFVKEAKAAKKAKASSFVYEGKKYTLKEAFAGEVSADIEELVDAVVEMQTNFKTKSVQLTKNHVNRLSADLKKVLDEIKAANIFLSELS